MHQRADRGRKRLNRLKIYDVDRAAVRRTPHIHWPSQSGGHDVLQPFGAERGEFGFKKWLDLSGLGIHSHDLKPGWHNPWGVDGRAGADLG